MKRIDFIKNCSITCLGMMALPFMFDACTPIYYATARNENNRLHLAKSEFEIYVGNQIKYRSYVVLKNSDQDYPIIVYRDSQGVYSAILLRCTHQGNELNIHGDLLSCPAHGSEFAKNGKVIQGPAEEDLKKFETITDETSIYIQLT